jgi:hypothetical protein
MARFDIHVFTIFLTVFAQQLARQQQNKKYRYVLKKTVSNMSTTSNIVKIYYYKNERSL